MTTLAHLQRKHENHLAAELDYGKLCKAEPRPQNQSGWGRDLKSPSESHSPSWAPPLLLLSGCLSKIQPKLWGPPVRVSTSHSVPKCWAQREKQHCSRLSAWQLLVETLPMCLQLEETKKKNGKKKKRRRRREREREKKVVWGTWRPDVPAGAEISLWVALWTHSEASATSADRLSRPEEHLEKLNFSCLVVFFQRWGWKFFSSSVVSKHPERPLSLWGTGALDLSSITWV